METVWSKTSQLIREHGWAQGNFEAGRGEKFCLATGLGEAACVLELRPNFSVREGFRKKLSAELGVPYYDAGDIRHIWKWNDHPSRTEEEVHALLRRLHVKEITAFDIGEPLKEIEFEPIPETAPVEEPSPVKEPVKEPQPA